MAQKPSAAEAFLERFTAWARARADVRGALVVGSRARTVEPADALSDVDLLLVTTRPRFYASTTAWIRELDEPVLTCSFSTVVGARAVRSADFDGRDGPLHVDFALVGALEARWAGLLLRLLARRPGAIRFVPWTLRSEIHSWFEALRKGSPRVLVDKGGAASRMVGIVPPPADRTAPTAAGFAEIVHSFFSLSLWKSKLLLRGEGWMAAQVCDRQIKDRLLRMLEWHASADGRDVWYTGRFVERWADPAAAAALREVFGRYDEDDAWRALFASVDLFVRLGHETAERFGHAWPAAAEQLAGAWLRRRFEARDDGRRGSPGAPPSG
jgi:aminoglycoside 6-adenylyltransferase